MPPPITFRSERRLRKRHLAMLVPLALMAFLALRSSPFMQELIWMPRWLAAWADRHWVLRSFVGFFAFGLLWFLAVSPRRRHALALAAFGTAVEVAQIWIPRRVFDWKDIVASVLGVLAAWLLVWTARALHRRSISRI